MRLGEHNIEPNYFEQNQAEALDLELTVLETLVKVRGEGAWAGGMAWRVDGMRDGIVLPAPVKRPETRRRGCGCPWCPQLRACLRGCAF